MTTRDGFGNGGPGPAGGRPGPPWPPPSPPEQATAAFGTGYPPPPAPGGGQPARTPATHGRRPNRSRARRRFRVLLVAGLLAGIGGLTVSVVGAVVQIMPRNFTAAQRQQITAWEIAKRWRTWPAGQIFPSAISYTMPGKAFGGGPALSLTAQRVGLAPQASCREGTQRAANSVLAKHGCLAVLRATYEDTTQTLAVTVGVAVLPTQEAAQEAASSLGGTQPSAGVRAVSFRRTVTARFGGRSGKLMWDRVTGPYLVIATVGFADGRPWIARGNDTYTEAELLSLASGTGQRVASALGAAPLSPHCPGSPAC